MQLALAVLAAVSIASPAGTPPSPAERAVARAVERAAINDNRTPAGTLRGRVLTVRLEAREADWRPDRDSDPGIVVRVFAERGRRAMVPGPLIRVPEGTEIHAFVTNTVSSGTLVVRGLSTRGARPGAEADTIQVRAGATREVRFLAGAAGTYYYSGTIDAPRAAGDRAAHDAELHGAFIVDARGTLGRARDRVLVIGLWNRTPDPNGLVNRSMLFRFTINGKTWPNTERLTYAVGDSVRFRIVNASNAVHPMHLHGFYFNVDSRGNGVVDTTYGRGSSPRLVVTERTAGGRTFTMTWVPERVGNWLFHCHDNFHVLRNAPLDGTPLAREETLHPANHSMEMMGGLVMGIHVRGREAPVRAPDPARRRLRLVARVDSGGTPTQPAFGYVLQEGTTTTHTSPPLLPGPTILLERGKPVGITVVNELPEATAVHWHGIELDSYFDGVAGFSGAGRRISPAIAPGDSFEARFTPPRSGTFIYHPHADEVRQQQAGLAGLLLVHDAPSRPDPATDIALMITVPRLDADNAKVLVNGSLTPPALDLQVGRRYRLRLVNVHTYRPSMIARLAADSVPVRWRAVAKDGMDLPADQATTRPAVQLMGNGETFDFELAPAASADLTFTVSSAAGALLASFPVRVR